MNGGVDPITYLTTRDVLDIHELVVESNDDTEAGVQSPGDVEYAIGSIREGHFGQSPDTVHDISFQLLRLLVANHPFVDGNKRTALMSVSVFYALNGLEFDYDREIKEILKDVATDEEDVDAESVRSYLREHTVPLTPEYEGTVELWLSLVDRSGASGAGAFDDDDDEPNDYDDRSPTDT